MEEQKKMSDLCQDVGKTEGDALKNLANSAQEGMD